MIRVRGITFVGTATDRRSETSEFLERTLGLRRVEIGGVGADAFELEDGTVFAVAGPRALGETSRTIGLLVDDVDEALAELARAGVEPEGPVTRNDRMRYVHVRFPDGKLYELVDERV
jgi:hypothetical protein